MSLANGATRAWTRLRGGAWSKRASRGLAFGYDQAIPSAVEDGGEATRVMKTNVNSGHGEAAASR